MLKTVLEKYGINTANVLISQLNSGLINNTWKVDVDSNTYIFQKINTHVFKNPEDIATNILAIANYLKINFPEYLFVAPIAAQNGAYQIKLDDNQFYRAFKFVENSKSIDVVQNEKQAYEAAKQFGRYTKYLHQFDTTILKATIPNFHNLSLRYQQFLEALQQASNDRLKLSETAIETCKLYKHIVDTYESIVSNPQFKLRVTHHDTKISNVLLNETDIGLCVIDLDTVMPGYFISDVGDMMRTYLSPVSEEETDFSKIEIRKEIYIAIVKGYYSEMKDVLTEIEKEHFFYAGTFIIYMQALRFLTDFLNNDTYYGAKYTNHNLNRANNQLVLLKKLIGNKKDLSNIV
jgi:thiamine kinase-like enzyme